MSSDIISSELALVDCIDRNARLTSGSNRSAKGPSPRWSIADWVRLPPSLWVLEMTRSAPCDRAFPGTSGWNPKGDLGKRPHVGDGAEVAGGHHVGRDRLGPSVQGFGEGIGTQPVGSADLGVHVGLNVVADETAEDHSVHHAGVHAALHHDMLAKVAKRQAGDKVSFGCAVGHQPGAAGPPRLGSEPGRLLQGRGCGSLVDPVHQRRQIEFQHPFTEQL